MIEAIGIGKGSVTVEDVTKADLIVIAASRARVVELTQKATMAGIPVLAAVSAPSSLAVDLGQPVRVTLVAFLRGDSMNVYTRPDRIQR